MQRTHIISILKGLSYCLNKKSVQEKKNIYIYITVLLNQHLA